MLTTDHTRLERAQELTLQATEKQQEKWLKRLDEAVDKLSATLDEYECFKCPEFAEAAYRKLLEALQADLSDRKRMVKDLPTQRDARVLSTYLNVWRLSPRLASPDMMAAKTVLDS